VSLDGATAQSVAITASDADTLSLTLDGGSAVTFDVADVEAVTATELADAVNALFDAESVDITASTDGGELVLTADTASSSDVASVAVSNVAETLAGASDSGLAGGAESLTNVEAKTVDTLVSEINASSSLDDKVRASNDNGSLRIENQSTNDLTVTGVTSSTIDGGSGTDTIDGNEVRKDLATQFNDLRDQLDKLSDDSSFNGINLLQGDLLTITFNETSTSTLDIQSEDGETINSAYLGLSTIDADALDADTDIDSLIDTVKSALGTIRSQASTFGSNLSMVENREDFTKNMINTLETGA
ncbi:hypothetical protein CH339_23480, partial [Rhodobium orientis]